MSNSEDTTQARTAAREIDNWAMSMTGHSGPTAAELQASLSWRVTAPLRHVQPRRRLASLRRGGLGRISPLAEPEELALARDALAQRLRAVAPHILGSEGRALETPSAGALLARLVARVRHDNDRGLLWLLIIAVSGCFPDEAQLVALARDLETAEEKHAIARVLNHCGVWTERYGSVGRRVRVVSGGVVAVVDSVAKRGFNSGVQRVTRETMSRWVAAKRPFSLAVFTKDATALRDLHQDELTRVIDWDDTKSREVARDNDDQQDLIVPWKSTVLVPEIPGGHALTTLQTTAQYSGNRMVGIGYDTIPLSSAREVTPSQSRLFVMYLMMLKHFDEVVAISDSSAEEFAGFSQAVTTQGLRAPRVTALALPIEPVPAAEGTSPCAEARPVVLTVGGNERRKNQLAVLAASEQLWRRGLDFELVIMGGSGDREYTDVQDAVIALARKGRPVGVVRDVDETVLAQSYRRAIFTVFVSTHEGYGLPVAESLAVGVPVITTNYGSTAEIAAGGGCLTVDPRDDDDIASAMSLLLTEPGQRELLREQIRHRRDSSWDEYADALAAKIFQEPQR